MSTLIREKVEQAVEMLKELDIDCWLTFVRETTETCDPVLPLILGHSLTWQSALIITARGECIAIVGKHEDDAVRTAGGGGVWRVQPYVQSIRGPLVTTLQRLNPRKIAVNYSMSDVKADGLSHGCWLLLQEYLKESGMAERLVSAGDVIRGLRGRKSREEVQRIRRAIDEAERLFERLEEVARPGMTERQVHAYMHDVMGDVRCSDGAAVTTAWDAAQCPLVTTGPRSSVGHAAPSDDLMIERGSIFHVDFGLCVDSYCSDIQRSWYVLREGEREAPTEVLRGFAAVRGAIDAAFGMLKPGVKGWEVDAAARRALVEAGFAEYEHATGHTVGWAAHDGGCVLGPRWERYGTTPEMLVEAGNVFTLELGIENLDGRGYLGLEEMALVTERGAQWMTTPQRELWVIGTT